MTLFDLILFRASKEHHIEGFRRFGLHERKKKNHIPLQLPREPYTRNSKCIRLRAGYSFWSQGLSRL